MLYLSFNQVRVLFGTYINLKQPFYSTFDAKIIASIRFKSYLPMKIRIKGNSIRLRLTKSEVGLFCKEGNYTETINFGNSSLTYRLMAKEGLMGLAADYSGNTITVFMPMEAKQNWYDSPRVGYSGTVGAETENQLSILVEKDFVCMDEAVEDQSDNYPNPKLQHL